MDATEAEKRLAKMLGYLEQDTENPSLLRDCAEAGLAANQSTVAHDIFVRLGRVTELDDEARSLAGIAAMRSGNQATAQAHFSSLLDAHPEDNGLRFNLAWSLALQGQKVAALDTLDDRVTEALPQAAMLDLQLRHELGDFETAGMRLDHYVSRFPDYGPLQAAASVLAMDVDRTDLARKCAEKGGDHPDALSTLGALELGEDKIEEARLLFGRSLATRPQNPRANIGLGLAELAVGNAQASLDYLDLGAEQFDNHLGSWIAAGWAHFLAGDAETARARFVTAIEKDASFGEAQGSLAAMDAFAGNYDDARKRLDVASRLDRQSFSVALTAMVLAAADGDQSRADKLFELVAKQPLTHDGRTLAQVLAKNTI